MSDFAERIRNLSPKRLALLALELQSRLDEIERKAAEPIALIGLGCRVPGAAEGAEGFWRLLADGVDAISPVPEDRWDAHAYFDSNPDAPGRTATVWGGFLSGIDRFDAPFFGISPREALGMDPQQRMLLEVCWQALEDAGQSPRKLVGSSTGVFIGLSTSDYYNLLLARGEESIDAYVATGTSHSVAAGRISYALGLNGPSMAVDTSCSASLVAVHLACQSLRTRESDLALAGGANAILAPEVTIALSKAHMMASDGRSKTFDSRADGFVRGEGCGIVILKRLSDALAARDRILALIRGSAVNQDGRSSGLTAPNGSAQQAVIRQALTSAGVQPHEIDYVEAHGTGTSLGDPIEAHALAAALGPGRHSANPLLIGSVKTNIGHLESAAGVVGLIKTVLALQHGQIPRHLHFQQLNPHIDWGGVPVEIPVQTKPWPRADRKRLAGVSSFGFSGTNAHVIVEEAPLPNPTERPVERPLHLLALSARSPEALATLAERYATNLATSGDDLGDISYTANSGRAQLDQRAWYLAATRQEMLESLRLGPVGRGQKQTASEIVFLFPGQGAQFPGMGKELYDTHPEFRRSLDECASLLREEIPEPLLEVLWARTELLEETRYTQPALFALEYALAQLWRSWGIQPSAVLGHSVGEYVAASIAGVYSLADGLKLIAGRARLMQQVPGNGAMTAVMAPESTVRQAIAGLESQVRIAALNAPESIVISGYLETIEIAETRLRDASVRTRRLNVSHAFHSPQMAAMEHAFVELVKSIRFQTPRVELISSVTGKPVGNSEMSDPEYWRRQVSEPVRFAAAMETLGAKGYGAYMEVGPGSTLSGLGKQSLTSPDLSWTPSLRENRGAWQQMLESLGQLWARGAEVDWVAFDRPYHRGKVSLPTYPFERRRYWPATGIRRPGQLPAAAEAYPVPEDWFYKLAWEPKPAASVYLQEGSADEGAHNFNRRASVLRTEEGLDRYDLLSPALRSVCTDFITLALSALGWEFTPGSRISIRDLFARGVIMERHARLFDRLLDILAEDGKITREGDICSIIRSPQAGDPVAAITALQAEYPAFHAELEMTARCAGQLASALGGKIDPLTLLFPEGSSKTAEAIYSHSPAPRVFNRLAAELVVEEIQKRPAGNIRIVEVGAGTGGTTAYVAPLLPPGRTEYAFTDISSFFRARAKERFGQYGFFEYTTLDIEKDPVEQGFSERRFDIAIAANVLHATANLRETLAHLLSLLAPGGLLLLVEGTYPERWVDLTFGLTEGWWRFRDTELRTRYPLLSRQAWLDLLTECGFEHAAAIQPLEGSHQCVIFARTPTKAHRWLIAGDMSGMGQALARDLERAGGTVVLTAASELDAAIGSEPWDHIVALVPSGAAELADWTAERIGDESLARAFEPVATLQSMLRSGCTAKLWVVTRGAQALDAIPAATHLIEAGAWGVARCIGLEHPAIWGGVLDLDPAAPDEENARQCLAAILGAAGEDQAAIRAGQRYVPRLLRTKPPHRRPLHIRRDGAYLVTGGLGEIGLHAAGWLAESGARHLVLAGRTGLPERNTWEKLGENTPEGRRVAKILAIEATGCTVTIARLDIADEAAVTELLGRLPVPLRGILHLAAGLGAQTVAQMSRQEFASVLRAKTSGTWALHRATASMELDFFVLFSSSTSLLGAKVLAHYAAANQFLDAFAHYRSQIGLPAIAVNWGAWPVLGSTSDQDRDRFFRGGLIPMEWKDALAVLAEMTAADTRQVMIGRFDWAVLKPLYESQKSLPLLERLNVKAAESEPVRVAQAVRSGRLSELRQKSGSERRQALVQYLVESLAQVLGTAPEGLDPARPVTDFGVDSLMALEFKNRIGSEMDFAIPTVQILQGPTLLELAALIDGGSLSTPAAEPDEHAAVPVDQYPLSYGQQAQFFAHKFMPGSSTFNVAFTAKATPCMEWDSFVRALERLVARHPAMRTIIVETDEGSPVQRVLKTARPDVVLINAENWSEEQLKNVVIGEFRRAFVLDRPLFRVCVFRRNDSDVILFNVDHMIIDAWSLRLCFAELKVLYAAELNSSVAELPEVSADYFEFSKSEASLTAGPEGEKLLEYWKRQLRGPLPILALKSSRSRPAVLVAEGECLPLTFGAALSAEVHRVAREYRSTVYAVLLAAFQVLLHQYTGQDDIIVGTSASGREDPRWARAVGYFVNLLPLRGNLAGNPTFADLVQSTRDTVLGALEHQAYPFARLVTDLRVPRNLERSPVFQAFFNFLTDRAGDLGPLFMGVQDCAVSFGSSILTPSVIIPQQEGQSEVVLQLAEVAGEFVGNLNYNSHILDRPVAEEMARQYLTILETAVRQPKIHINDLAAEFEDLVL